MAGRTLSAWWLAIGRTLQGLKPGGSKIFSLLWNQGIPVLGATQPPQMVTGVFRRRKWAVMFLWTSTPSRTKFSNVESITAVRFAPHGKSQGEFAKIYDIYFNAGFCETTAFTLKMKVKFFSKKSVLVPKNTLCLDAKFGNLNVIQSGLPRYLLRLDPYPNSNLVCCLESHIATFVPYHFSEILWILNTKYRSI
jgi:hypothetical protein